MAAAVVEAPLVSYADSPIESVAPDPAPDDSVVADGEAPDEISTLKEETAVAESSGVVVDLVNEILPKKEFERSDSRPDGGLFVLERDAEVAVVPVVELDTDPEVTTVSPLSLSLELTEFDESNVGEPDCIVEAELEGASDSRPVGGILV